MDDHHLDRSLRSVGMMCFVKYIDLFSNKGISDSAAVDYLMAHEAWEITGCKTRVNRARLIISEGRKNDALRWISQSKRIEAEWAQKARSLLPTSN